MNGTQKTKNQAIQPAPGWRSRAVWAAFGVAMVLSGCSTYDDELAATPDNAAIVEPAQAGLVGEATRPSYVEGVTRRRPVPLTETTSAPASASASASALVERESISDAPSPPPGPLIAVAPPPATPAPTPPPTVVRVPTVGADPILQAEGVIPVAANQPLGARDIGSDEIIVPPTAPPYPVAEARALMRVPPVTPPGSTAATGMLIAPPTGGPSSLAPVTHDAVDELGTVVIDASGVQLEQFVPGIAAPTTGFPGFQAAGPSVQVFDEGMDASLPPGSFDPSGTGASTLVATIQFGVGSAALGPQDRAVLRKVAQLYDQFGGSVRVVGHASSRTANMDWPQHKSVNLQVSARRAQAVAQALNRYSIPDEAIYVGAVGDNDPLYYEVMPAGEAGNRRTEIYFDY